MKLRKTNRNFFFAAAFCLAALFAAPIHAALTVEFDGADVRISNTNATPDRANITLSSKNQPLAIPANADNGLSAGAWIKLDSLDFGNEGDSLWGDHSYTYAQRLKIVCDEAVFVSDIVVEDSEKRFPNKDGETSKLRYSFRGKGCVLTVGQSYSLSFLDENDSPMTYIRYTLVKNADTILPNTYTTISGNTYAPMLQLNGTVGTDGETTAPSRFTSTYAKGSWFMPNDTGIAGTENLEGHAIGNHPMAYSLNSATAQYMEATVLAEIPANASGTVAAIGISKDSETHSVWVKYNGDKTFSLTYDDGANYVTSKKVDVSGFHIYSLGYNAGYGTFFYQDANLILGNSSYRWSSSRISGTADFGTNRDGLLPLTGMTVYAADTYFYDWTCVGVSRVFSGLDFMAGYASESIPTRLSIFKNYSRYGVHGTASLNGADADLSGSIKLISIFGARAVTCGVTFGLTGIDLSGKSFSMTVDPPVQNGNSLSILGCRDLGDRWRRVNVSCGGSTVSVPEGDFDEYRFFKLRAEQGEKPANSYATTEIPSINDDATETSSLFTSATVAGDVQILSLSMSDGEDGDYSVRAYRSISFELAGVADGATCRLKVGDETLVATNEGGSVRFFGLPALAEGTTLTLAVQTAKADGNGTAIDSTVMDIRAGVLSYSWGDGSGGTIEGGVTNTMTMLANKPTTDGLGGSSGGGYRIPGIAKSTNGVIVAVYDCRYNGTGDLPNKIDIAENCSTDNARTWTMPRIAIDVPNGGSANKAYDIGDPCILYNPADDKFWLMGITGNGLHTTATDADVVLYTRGTGRDDKWKAWEGDPADDKRSVQQMILDSLNSADPDNTTSDVSALKGILQGPGHGFVQRNNVTNAEGAVVMPKGALVFPMQYFPLNTTTLSHNFAVYSTDCGTNWVSSALTPGKTPNGADCYAQEGCIVELDDGTWEYMGKFGNGDTDASGDNGRRLFFRSRNFKDWAFDGYHPHDSIRAQGSVLWLGDGVKTRFGSSRYAACFSTWGNYPSERRGRVKLFFGQDTSSNESKPGITWDCGEMMLIPEHTGACSYNSMVMIDDDTLGVLIESHCHIYLIKVDLTEVLTK